MRRGGTLVFVFCSSCSAPGEPASNTLIDSAGVEIVSYGRQLPAGIDRLTIDSAPPIVIGNDSGPYLLSRVQFVGHDRNGQLVLFEADALEFRIFDSLGAFVKRFSGRGAGPGEVQNPIWIGMDGNDSIRVFDVLQKRLTTFAASGTTGGTVSWARLSGMDFPIVIAVAPDGSVLSSRRRMVDPTNPAQVAVLQKGRFRDSVTIFRVARDGSAVTTIGTFPSTERCRVFTKRSVHFCSAPFVVRRAIAVADSIVYVGTGERYEIRGYNLAGKLVRIIRRDLPPVPVPSTAINQWKRLRAEQQAKGRAAEATPPDRELERALEEAIQFPSHYPAYEDILEDRDGNLWVKDFVPFASGTGASRWVIFDRNGRIKATVTVPGTWPSARASIHLEEFSLSYLTGISYDTNNVPQVVSHRLRKEVQ